MPQHPNEHEKSTGTSGTSDIPVILESRPSSCSNILPEIHTITHDLLLLFVVVICRTTPLPLIQQVMTLSTELSSLPHHYSCPHSNNLSNHVDN